MAKEPGSGQGQIGSIRRRCIVCKAMWNDPDTILCPKCLYWLTKVISKVQGEETAEKDAE